MSLQALAEKFLSSLQITIDERDIKFYLTQKQGKNSQWQKFRKGRVHLPRGACPLKTIPNKKIPA